MITNQNDIPVTNTVILPPINVQASPIVCRICLANDGEMITPCACKGSIEKIHKTCLYKWIRKSKLSDCQTYETQKQIKCQICHDSITFTIFKKKQCGFKNLQSNWKYQRGFLVAHILIIIGFIISIGFMSKAINDTINKKGSMQMQQATFIAVCTILSLLAIFLSGLIYRLVIENFIYMNYVITKINEYGQKILQRSPSSATTAATLS